MGCYMHLDVSTHTHTVIPNFIKSKGRSCRSGRWKVGPGKDRTNLLLGGGGGGVGDYPIWKLLTSEYIWRSQKQIRHFSRFMMISVRRAGKNGSQSQKSFPTLTTSCNNLCSECLPNRYELKESLTEKRLIRLILILIVFTLRFKITLNLCWNRRRNNRYWLISAHFLPHLPQPHPWLKIW